MVAEGSAAGVFSGSKVVLNRWGYLRTNQCILKEVQKLTSILRHRGG